MVNSQKLLKIEEPLHTLLAVDSQPKKTNDMKMINNLEKAKIQNPTKNSDSDSDSSDFNVEEEYTS